MIHTFPMLKFVWKTNKKNPENMHSQSCYFLKLIPKIKKLNFPAYNIGKK